ncbi:MAG: PLP-dependent aminotransferase family protein [Defluviitaleaceae bacterium]|nr:PLP-dependent aminotransferase family protein [Defluviitaleaceae bacterium]
MQMLRLDKNCQTPLYKQLGDAISAKITQGEFLPNERLPAIRTLALELEVNNTTIISAYKYLEQRNAVYSITGSGTYVKPTENPIRQELPKFTDCINFATTSTDSELFPLRDFRNAFDSVLARDGAKAFDYAGWRGYAPLREVISQMLLKSEIISSPKNIQIIPDTNTGISLVADALLGAGDAVIIESPAPQRTMAIFAARGVKILEVPLDKNGLDMEQFSFLAEKYMPKLFFLTPTYQNPTGLCYTEHTKEKILELAHKINAYIIEEDNFSDFYYFEKPKTLKAADVHERVIYIKSFDKVLTSGIAGFIAFPKKIRNLRDSGGASGYIQRSLDYYFRDDKFDEHLAKMRENYAGRYNRAIMATETFLSPYASFIKPNGGLSLWVTLKGKHGNYIDKFSKHKVIVSPGDMFWIKPSLNKSFRLSFASASEDEISRGVGIIASVLNDGY